ncbi:hypothetical protein PH5382_01007 [Phaeobacter sp. CECT 5382]|nr:hypothetical protein PH5382_01007 [Phaeobacter sp. CECT 5382]
MVAMRTLRPIITSKVIATGALKNVVSVGRRFAEKVSERLGHLQLSIVPAIDPITKAPGSVAHNPALDTLGRASQDQSIFHVMAQ